MFWEPSPRSMKSTARLSPETNAPLRPADGTCRVGRLGPVPHEDIDMCDRRH